MHPLVSAQIPRIGPSAIVSVTAELNEPVGGCAQSSARFERKIRGERKTGLTLLGALANNVETWSNSAANVAQVVAIVVGGWWAYDRFIRVREQWPRATLDQRAAHRRLNDEYTLLRLDLRIHNAGEVLLELRKVRAEAYQVLPLADSASEALSNKALVPADEFEAEWPCLVDYERKWQEQEVEIEPQEGDELGFDFVIPSETRTVFLYCYVWNASKNERQIGWSATLLYDIDGDSGEQMISSRELSGRS